MIFTSILLLKSPSGSPIMGSLILNKHVIIDTAFPNRSFIQVLTSVLSNVQALELDIYFSCTWHFGSKGIFKSKICCIFSMNTERYRVQTESIAWIKENDISATRIKWQFTARDNYSAEKSRKGLSKKKESLVTYDNTTDTPSHLTFSYFWLWETLFSLRTSTISGCFKSSTLSFFGYGF